MLIQPKYVVMNIIYNICFWWISFGFIDWKKNHRSEFIKIFFFAFHIQFERHFL